MQVAVIFAQWPGRRREPDERQQVFDLPPMQVWATEHQLISRRGVCGVTTCARARRGDGTGAVRAEHRRDHPVSVCGTVPVQARTAQALAELFDTPVSEGTVAAMCECGANRLGEFCDRVGDAIAKSEIGGFPESGLRVADACTGCTASAPTSSR